MKATEVRKMSTEQLNEKLTGLKKDLFYLRMQHATNQLDNPLKIKETKHDIARVKTMSAAKSWHLSGKEGIGTMSRIGRMPITVPAGVTVTIADGNVVTVKGPKGELHRSLRPEMIIKQDGNTITVERPSDDKLHRSLHGLTRSLLHNMIVYFLMIIGFSYFYSTIQFNPVEIANNLKKQGGFIPGFRPGKPTIDFIKKVLNKVTLFGAIYLGIVAICPLILGKIVNNNHLAIGGTSVIIIVGVALETVQALESQMLMRQYKGFLE